MNVGSLNLLIPLWYLWKILIDEMQNYLHIKLKILMTASSTSIWLLRTPQTHEDLFTVSPCYPMCIVIAKITCYGSNLRSMTGEVVSLQIATFRMLVLLTEWFYSSFAIQSWFCCDCFVSVANEIYSIFSKSSFWKKVGRNLIFCL